MPDLMLSADAGHLAAAEHSVSFLIASHVELQTKPGASRPFRMRATRLRLSWGWQNGEWRLYWSFNGHRWRTTKNDWSPLEQGYMSARDLDLPDWVQPLIEANAPIRPPVADPNPIAVATTRQGRWHK